MAETEKQVFNFSDSVKNALINTVVQGGIELATSAIKGFLSSIVSTGMQFDTAMSQVAAISGATGADLGLLEKTARDFGTSTQISASGAAADGNIGNAFNLIALPMQGFAGYFRPNAYTETATKPAPEAKPAAVKPAASSASFSKGDRVRVLKHIDVNGTALMNLQNDYLVYQVSKATNTVVLKSDDGDIYARISMDNIQKV